MTDNIDARVMRYVKTHVEPVTSPATLDKNIFENLDGSHIPMVNLQKLILNNLLIIFL